MPQLESLPKPDTQVQQAHLPTHNVEEIWKASLEQLRMYVSERDMKIWFSEVFLKSIENGVAELSCDRPYARERIETNHRALLKRILSETIGQKVDIAISIRSSVKREGKAEEKDKKKDSYQYYTPQGTDIFSSVTPEETSEKRAREAQLNPRYSFKSFVVGAHNRLAHAVGEGVIEGLGTTYNPVFIYGATGVGKTHLMQAIGNEVITRFPDKKVAYVSIEQFLNEMVDAIRTKKTPEFREKYREIDLLIVDDIQLIENFPQTQEELFHTFNTLYQSNKQVILASDRAPRDIKNLVDRLRSRFEGGMVADIQVPDYETRIAILRQVADDKNVEIPSPILDMIAKNIESNVRELEGAVTKVISISRLGEPLTEELVSQMLQFDFDSKRKRISPEKVLGIVGEVFDVTTREIKGKRRTAYIAMARQVVMYLLRNELGLPLEKVAREVNRKDHTTVLHACQKIEKLTETDNTIAERLEKCKSLLNGY